MLVNTHVSLM